MENTAEKPRIQMAGYMEDAQGRQVPENMVNEIDKTRDDLIYEIVFQAEDLSQILATFKTGVMADIEAFIQLSGEKYGISVGGKKGNVTLMSFDGRYKVMRSITERVDFDERLQVAKELIDQCIQEWSETSRDEVKVLINDAFYVDKKGKLNTNRILGLRRLNITDGKWKQAMNAIGESITVAGSKAYVRIYERKADGSYKQINLDLAAL